MTDEILLDFLKRILILIENAEHLLIDSPARHIPAYHKILGIQQKIEKLSQDDQKVFFAQIICLRGLISYFLNGRYDDGNKNLKKLKKDFIEMALKADENIKNSLIRKTI